MSKENGRIEDCVCRKGHCNPKVIQVGPTRLDQGFNVTTIYDVRKMLIKDKDGVIYSSQILNSPIESCPNLPNAKTKIK